MPGFWDSSAPYDLAGLFFGMPNRYGHANEALSQRAFSQADRLRSKLEQQAQMQQMQGLIGQQQIGGMVQAPGSYGDYVPGQNEMFPGETPGSLSGQNTQGLLQSQDYQPGAGMPPMSPGMPGPMVTTPDFQQGTGLLGGQMNQQQFAAGLLGVPGLHPSVQETALKGLMATPTPVHGVFQREAVYDANGKAVVDEFGRQKEQFVLRNPTNAQVMGIGGGAAQSFAGNKYTPDELQKIQDITTGKSPPAGTTPDQIAQGNADYQEKYGQSRYSVTPNQPPVQTAMTMAGLAASKNAVKNIMNIIFEKGDPINGKINGDVSLLGTEALNSKSPVINAIARIVTDDQTKILAYNVAEPVADVTRAVSGAVMTPPELASTAIRFTPVAGDPDSVIRSKMVKLQLYLQNATNYLDPQAIARARATGQITSNDVNYSKLQHDADKLLNTKQNTPPTGLLNKKRPSDGMTMDEINKRTPELNH